MTEIIGLDHIYITVSELDRSEVFYDQVFLGCMGFRKNKFALSNIPHIQYFNRHMGYVLRPSQTQTAHNPVAPGLHHLCFRVDSVSDVADVATQLRNSGIEASTPKRYPDYAADYWATYFNDPDGIQLEVTNYRMERRDRHDNWYPNIGD
jgi:catechol 2,3-dioxygenase-like lactoylglutathione lyase family enzyme